MDLFGNDFKYALRRISGNKDFQLILAYLYDEQFSKSAFTGGDPCETAYKLGKQDFIREVVQQLSEAEQKSVTKLVEKYNER